MKDKIYSPQELNNLGIRNIYQKYKVLWDDYQQMMEEYQELMDKAMDLESALHDTGFQVETLKLSKEQEELIERIEHQQSTIDYLNSGILERNNEIGKLEAELEKEKHRFANAYKKQAVW